MTTQRLFPSFFSRSLLFSVATICPLILGTSVFGATVALAQTTQASANVKPLSNRAKLLQENLSGKRGAPSRRFGGGSRVTNVCAVGPQAMAMIAPADNVTVTTSAQPSLMLWVNGSQSERDLELVLRDGNDEPVYSKMLKLSDKSGLVTLDLSKFDDAPSLNQTEDYYLYLSLICDSSDRSKDVVVEGQLSYVDLQSWVAQNSVSTVTRSNLTPLSQVEKSLELGLWHDAMAQLNGLRQEGSTEAVRQQAQQRWQELLAADDELHVIAEETREVMSPLAITNIQEWMDF